MTIYYAFVIRTTRTNAGAFNANDGLYKVATQVKSVFGWGEPANTVFDMHPVADNTILFPPESFYINNAGQSLHDSVSRLRKVWEPLHQIFDGFRNFPTQINYSIRTTPVNDSVHLLSTDKIPAKFSSFFDGCWKFRRQDQVYLSTCSVSKTDASFLRFRRNWMPTHPVYLNDFGQMRTPVYYPKSRI